MVESVGSIEVVAALARVSSLAMRRFESGLPGGLGFNDFVILYHLERSPEGKLRRVDLAEMLGITASGITRLVAPLEKLGIVRREESEHDGRVVYVALARGGRRLFQEALETAIYNSEKIIPEGKVEVYRKLLGEVRV